MRGLIEKGTKFAYQAAIPVDVREAFGGKKKFQKIFQTQDRIHAERLAAEADREFRSRVNEIRRVTLNGARVDPNRKHQIAGFLFGRYFNRPLSDFTDLREQLAGEIREQQEEENPLFEAIYTEGALFDELLEQVETMLEWAENVSFVKTRKADRPDATIIGAHRVWASRTKKHTQKTRDQYGKDVRDFSAWFEERRGHCYGAKVNKRDVNQYVAHLMHRDCAKATITRALSALRLVYKVGQFSDDNPFSHVNDRIEIDGSRLEVRRFTDTEVLTILKQNTDSNSALVLKIAAYSGMRLSEICALKWEHIEQHGRTYVFNLRNAGKRKTKASYREVPVHSVIWRDLSKSKGDRLEYLIPDEPVDKYKNRSAAISKRIGLVIDRVCPDPEARFHGFRHTFITKMSEAGVRKELRQAIVGHATGDTHDGYVHADYLKQLLTEVKKVHYA